MAEQSTHNLKFQGSIPATAATRVRENSEKVKSTNLDGMSFFGEKCPSRSMHFKGLNSEIGIN